MITFAFTFPAGRYHATPWGRHANEADVAWPPEPVRILRAMIAAWWRKTDRERFPKPVLDGLIDSLASGLPQFRLPEAVHSHTRAFMPAPVDRKLIFDGFLCLDRNAELICSWSDVCLSPDQEALASYLLERIGYLGRAESWVEGRLAPNWDGTPNAVPRGADGGTAKDSVAVDTAISLSPADWSSFRDGVRPTLKEMPKARRAVVESTLPERLSDALAVDTGWWQHAGWSSPPPLRQVVYQRPPIGPTSPHRKARLRSAHEQPGKPEVARFVLAGRPPPRIEDTVRIAEIARSALIALSKRGENGDTPVELLGRDANGALRRDPQHGHAFYLPEDADGDGHIDHLIVYCRNGFSLAARQCLDRLNRLWLSRGQADEAGAVGRKEWRLALEDIAAPGAFNDSPLLGKDCTWQSVTPYLHPWHRKPRFGIEDQIRKEIAERGWPVFFAAEQVNDVTCQGRSLRPVHFHRFRSRHRLVQPDTTGSLWRLTFDEPVPGPIALGWGCHFGLGLFLREIQT